MTPSPELIRDIRNAAPQVNYPTNLLRETYIAETAYQAGADAELEACCEWLEQSPYGFSVVANDVTDQLRATRRPKPPSLKHQALQAVAAIEGDFNTVGDRCDMIRKALETLPDD